MRSPTRKRRPLGVAGLSFLGLALGLGACRIPVGVDHAAGAAPRCENGLCTEVVYFESHVNHIGMWIDAQPGTRLLNARVAADDAPPCQGQFPVEWIKLDDVVHVHGPVDLAGPSGAVLSFPLNTWFGHYGYWRAMFVDLQFEVAGAARCVRTRLTNDEGRAAVGQ